MKKLISAKDIIEDLKTTDPESYSEIKENTKTVKNTWGGKRASAGRKPKNPNNVLVFQMKVSDSEREFLYYAREHNINYKDLMQGQFAGQALPDDFNLWSV